VLTNSIVQDIRFATRQLRQAPGFAAVAILSLALGIGANLAMFQLIDALRLRMLPVDKPAELAYVDFQRGSARAGWWSTRSARLTSTIWNEIQSQQQAFSGLAGWSAGRFNLAQGGEARYAESLYVNGDFFKTLGVQTMIGRPLTSADDNAACGNPGAVISHAFWQREFGGDPNVLTRNLTLDGHPIPVIGVTGPAFFGVEVGRRFDVAVPFCVDRLFADNQRGRAPLREAWWLSMMGRLKPGWTVQSADAHFKAISPAIMQATLPESYKPDLAKRFLANKLEITAGSTGVSGLRRQYEQPLWLLMATTALVLLIACANLANLLLARASVREREIAVRQAIGASRWRLIRQFVVESLLLSLGGTALGALLAQALTRALLSFFDSEQNPAFINLSFDWRLFAFTAALGLLTSLLFGLLPALRASGRAPALAMRAGGGRGMTAGRERFGLRRALVAAQVAMSLVLLVGALLFLRTLQNVLNTDPGFRPEGVLTVSVDFARAGYANDRRGAVALELRDKLASIPGALSVGQVGFTPVSGSGWDNSIGPDGTVAAASGKEAWFNRVGPGYFGTMGIGLVSGRDFNGQDLLAAPRVAVVNEAFATKFFGGANAVGRTFNVEAAAGQPETLYQIVGMVKNSKYGDLREEFRPQGFFPMTQDPRPGTDATFVIRVSGQRPTELISAVKAAVGEMSPAMSLQFRSMTAQLDDAMRQEKLMAGLSGGFGILAALLAALGLYGVISYMVARRHNEIGVRVALGADRATVIRLILREALLLLCVGLPIGVLLALWAGRGAATMLYGLKPYDPVSIGLSVGLLAVIAIVASIGPVRRALSVDPVIALRSE
jgi:putative ABC transport system permease protein